MLTWARTWTGIWWSNRPQRGRRWGLLPCPAHRSLPTRQVPPHTTVVSKATSAFCYTYTLPPGVQDAQGRQRTGHAPVAPQQPTVLQEVQQHKQCPARGGLTIRQLFAKPRPVASPIQAAGQPGMPQVNGTIPAPAQTRPPVPGQHAHLRRPMPSPHDAPRLVQQEHVPCQLAARPIRARTGTDQALPGAAGMHVGHGTSSSGGGSAHHVLGGRASGTSGMQTHPAQPLLGTLHGSAAPAAARPLPPASRPAGQAASSSGSRASAARQGTAGPPAPAWPGGDDDDDDFMPSSRQQAQAQAQQAHLAEQKAARVPPRPSGSAAAAAELPHAQPQQGAKQARDCSALLPDR